MRDIPSGDVASYGELALRIGTPRASRAVGAAAGANLIVIVIPCHRVVGSGGGLGGYGGGLDRKRWLLDHERTHAGAGARAPSREALAARPGA
jgi:O-6-methylguanine DNA methyltransferase